MGIAVATVLLGGTIPVAAADDPILPQGLIDLLASPLVDLNLLGEIVVNVATDPQQAIGLLETADSLGVLEGRTVKFDGLQIRSGDAQRILDDAIAALPASALTGPCPDWPVGARPEHPLPYLGCNPTSGLATLGAPALDSSTASVADAFAKVALAGLPGLDSISPTVSLSGGTLTVDLPQSFADAANGLQEQSRYLAGMNMLFTAYSVSGASTVTFTVAGDCMAYAVATGGDICTTPDLTNVPEGLLG